MDKSSFPTDDLNQLLNILPPPLGQKLASHPQRHSLVEVILDLGRLPEARFFSGAEYLAQIPVSHADLE
ncbi:MAG: hypothetical protein ACKO5P_07030, partial [Nodosilinea sp.]